jgi:hypothetical protein
LLIKYADIFDRLIAMRNPVQMNRPAIREAMRDGNLAPMGGADGIVEADETYYGKKAVRPTKRTGGRPFTSTGKGAHKIAIVSLVERGGNVRSFHVESADKGTSPESLPTILRTSRAFTPSKASSIAERMSSLPRTKPSSIRLKNKRAATFIPRSKRLAVLRIKQRLRRNRRHNPSGS